MSADKDNAIKPTIKLNFRFIDKIKHSTDTDFVWIASVDYLLISYSAVVLRMIHILVHPN